MLLVMTLQELRHALTDFSQEDVAEMLKITQGYVSKLERQSDMLLSHLSTYVQALGGEVEIRAKFPDHEVQITQFREIEKLTGPFSLGTSEIRRRLFLQQSATPTIDTRSEAIARGLTLVEWGR